MSGSQTTAAFNFTDAAVQYALNGGAWTDICGEATSITGDGFDRQASADFFTYCGDTPIVLPGKRNSGSVTVRIAVTEGASDPFIVALNAQISKGTKLQFRWMPRGNTPTNFRYSTDANSFVTSNPFPFGEAGSADITALDVTVKAAYVTKDVVP